MKIQSGYSFVLPLPGLSSDYTDLEMLWVEPGKFIMGAVEKYQGPLLEDEAPFEVILTKGFWLARYQVTQAHWLSVMDDNPSVFKDDLNRPVDNICWQDAMGFCQKINQMYGAHLFESYTFSLPTEAQWEYACRAGTHTLHYGGDSKAGLDKIAWYAGNSDSQTHPVGQKQPNPWGFFDMLGNVAEWCFDTPGEYPGVSSIDWTGEQSGDIKVLRGGSWGVPDDNWQIRAAHRSWTGAIERRPWFGFRLCLRA